MDELLIARMIHVIGMALWVGGVSFLVIILMPRLRSNPEPVRQFEFFLSVARPFAAWMRYVTLAVAISGFAMLQIMGAWDRYLDVINYWWIHLMTLTWAYYTALLVRQFINTRRKKHPSFDEEGAAVRLIKVSGHQRVVFGLSVITALAALYGVHGSW